MNINPIIETTLSGMTFRNHAMPLSHLKGSGSATAHMTYQTLLEKDGEYADDDAVETDTTGTVDVFVEMLGNYKGFAYSVRDRLKSVGFTTSYGPEQYEDSTNLYHATIDIYMEDCNG